MDIAILYLVSSKTAIANVIKCTSFDLKILADNTTHFTFMELRRSSGCNSLLIILIILKKARIWVFARESTFL